MFNFNPNDLYQDPALITNEEDGGEGGDDSSGGSGFNEPIMDMAVFGLVQSKIRDGERKFGVVPDPKEPYSESEGLRKGKGLLAHPALMKGAEFNGIADRKNNPNPPQNPEAEQHYEELRNEHALRLGQQLGKQQRHTKRLTVSSPRLTR